MAKLMSKRLVIHTVHAQDNMISRVPGIPLGRRQAWSIRGDANVAVVPAATAVSIVVKVYSRNCRSAFRSAEEPSCSVMQHLPIPLDLNWNQQGVCTSIKAKVITAARRRSAYFVTVQHEREPTTA